LADGFRLSGLRTGLGAFLALHAEIYAIVDAVYKKAMKEEDIRRAAITLFGNELEPERPATYIVFGNPRGGTTMLARLLLAFGIYLGEDLPVNQESASFNVDVLSRQGLTLDQISQSIRRTIDENNKEYQVWGWKYPKASLYLEQVWGSLVNPKLICVMRDPLANSMRSIIRQGVDPMVALKRSLRLQQKNLDLIAKFKVPTLLCSYEKCLNHPRTLVQSLHEFLGADLVHCEHLKDYALMINPEYGYQPFANLS
jgi:hypothetical protein